MSRKINRLFRLLFIRSSSHEPLPYSVYIVRKIQEEFDARFDTLEDMIQSLLFAHAYSAPVYAYALLLPLDDKDLGLRPKREES